MGRKSMPQLPMINEEGEPVVGKECRRCGVMKELVKNYSVYGKNKNAEKKEKSYHGNCHDCQKIYNAEYYKLQKEQSSSSEEVVVAEEIEIIPPVAKSSEKREMTPERIKQGQELLELIESTQNAVDEISKLKPSSREPVSNFDDNMYLLQITSLTHRVKLNRYQGNVKLVEVIKNELVRQLEEYKESFARI